MEPTLSELRAEFGRSRLLSIAGALALAGLMWMPISRILQHWVGLFHAVARTLLAAAVWVAFPGQRFTLIPAMVVVVCLISIAALATRSLLPATTRVNA